MKTVPANLATHIAQEVTTLVTCWKLTRRDGTIMGFTEHVADLTVSGQVYSAATGYTPTSLRAQGDLAVDSLNVMGLLDAAGVTEADLMAGVYDYAELEVFLVNYEAVADGIIKLKRGWLGEVSIEENRFIAEVRGLAQSAQQVIGKKFSPACRADLGDARCQVNLGPLTVAGSVTTATNRYTFRDNATANIINKADHYFRHGLVTWLTGNNAGREMEVKSFTQTNGIFTLVQSMPEAIQVGDTFNVYPGCDKALSTCKTKFNNVINFQGEPYVPGTDKLFQYPDAH